MWFVIIGFVMILSSLANVGPFAKWNFDFTGDLWKFCMPFVFAAIWWAWSESSGRDKRREMNKMEAKKEARRRDNLVALGMEFKAGRRKRRRR